MLGWFRRFCPSPPSAGLVPLSVGLRFSFPLPFQGLPVSGQVCRVGVLSVPLLLRSPLRVLVRYCSFHFHCHPTFIFISSAPPRWGVCVYHLNRCKTSYLAGGHRGPGGVGDQRRHLPGTRVNVPAGLWWCTWAHLSRSWWPPQSHIYIYILYIYIFFFHFSC